MSVESLSRNKLESQSDSSVQEIPVFTEEREKIPMASEPGSANLPKKPSNKRTRNKKKNVFNPSRFYKSQQLAQAKIQLLAKEEAEKELKHCTFQPKTNKTYSGHRPLEVFLESQTHHLIHRDKKINDLREKLLEQELSESCSQPVLCEKSLQMLSERSPRPTPSSPQLETSTFHPVINKKSHLLQRPKDITLHLYNSANPSPKHTEVVQSESKFLSKTSETYLTGRLISDLDAAFRFLEVTDELSYSVFLLVLEHMKFIKNNSSSSTHQRERLLTAKAWKTLARGNSSISKSTLQTFLLKTSGQVNSEFYFFMKNRKKSKLPTSPQEFPFKPALSPKTISLATAKQKSRTKDFLVSERQKIQENIKKKQMETERSELYSHSFQPKINKTKPKKNSKLQKDTHRTITLYELASAMKAQAQLKAEEAKADQLHTDQKLCTFKPRNSQHLLKDKKPLVEHKGVAETIERLRTARLDKARVENGGKTEFSLKFDLERRSKQLDSFNLGSPFSPVSPHGNKSLSFSRIPWASKNKNTISLSEESDIEDFEGFTIEIQRALDESTPPEDFSL